MLVPRAPSTIYNITNRTEWMESNKSISISFNMQNALRERCVCVCVEGRWPCAHACGNGFRFSANKNVSQMSIRRQLTMPENKRVINNNDNDTATETWSGGKRERDGNIWWQPWHNSVHTELKRTTTMSRLSNNGVRRSFSTFIHFIYSTTTNDDDHGKKNVWMKTRNSRVTTQFFV